MASKKRTFEDYLQGANSSPTLTLNLESLAKGRDLNTGRIKYEPDSVLANLIAYANYKGYGADQDGLANMLAQSGLLPGFKGDIQSKDKETRQKASMALVDLIKGGQIDNIGQQFLKKQGIKNLIGGSQFSADPIQQPLAGGGQAKGLQMSSGGALNDIYNQRTDLQELYNPDGSAKNVNDPRVAGIPTLQQWAQQYGASEYPTLQGLQDNTNPSSVGQPSFGGGSTAAPGVPATQSLTGVPELDAIYNRLQQYLVDLQSQGKTINPNIELTPATIQQFLEQAQTEVEPYYRNQIDSMKTELKSSLDNLQQQYDLAKQGQEAQFKQNLSGTREKLADQGAAQSGFRGQAEQELKQGTQRSLEDLGLGAANSAANALYRGAQTLGSRNISDLVPRGNFDVSTVSTAGAGGFGTGSSRSFFNPTDVTGSLEYARNADVRQLQDFLKQQEVTKRTLSFAG